MSLAGPPHAARSTRSRLLRSLLGLASTGIAGAAGSTTHAPATQAGAPPTLPDAPTDSQDSGPPAHVTLRDDTLRVTVDTRPWRLRVDGPADAPADRPLWREPDGGGEGYGPPAFDVGGRWERLGTVQAVAAVADALVMDVTTVPSGLHAAVTLELGGAGTLRLRAALRDGVAQRVAVSAATPPGERFLGLGERFTGVDQRGRTVRIWAEDRRAAGYGDSTYLPVPFFLSSRGYSLRLEGPAPARFELGSVRPDALAAVVEAPELACTLTYGPRPADLVRAHAGQTGLPPLPPVWAFGVVKSSLGGQQRVLADAQRLRRLGAPVSAIFSYDLLDAAANLGWPDPVYGAATHGPYPDPPGLSRALHALGFKLTGYFTLDVRPTRLTRGEHAAAARAGYLVRGPGGGAYRHPEHGVSWVDFTNPEAVAWWQSTVRRALLELGLDGGMVDFGELTPEDARFADGRTGREAHNDVPRLYHRALWTEAQRSKPDSVFWMRSGAAGDQCYHAATWCGDPMDTWEPVSGLRSLVPAALSAGLSGFPYWHPEVSGYVQALPPAEEKALWLRWLQLGAFSPMLRDHYGEKPHRPVDAWTDEETLREYLRYAAIHHRLAPYLCALAAEASETGLPLLRHLALEYPDDATAWQVEDAYLLGPDLLVAPVGEPDATGRRVYLPAGEWLDWWTGEAHAGGRWLAAAGGRHDIPVFVRAGAALPLLPDGGRSLADPDWDAVLRLHVAPAAVPTETRRRLHDGGWVTARVGATASEVAVSGAQARTYEVWLPGEGRVEVEGELLATLPRDGSATPWHAGPGVRVRGAAVVVRVQQRV